MPDLPIALSGRGGARSLFIQSFLAGIVASLPFQKHAPGLIAFVALVPFFLLLRLSAGDAAARARTGWFFGFGFYLGLLYWIGLLAQTAIPVRGLALGGLFFLSAYLALYPTLFALVAAGRWSRPVPFWVVGPIAWGLLEYVRSLGPLGFPWGALGYALVPYAPLIQAARIGSVDILTLAVVVVNALVAGAIPIAAAGRYRAPALRLAAALGVVFLLGLDGTRVIRAGPRASGPVLRLAVVQPNIAAEEKWTEAFKEESIRILGDLTREAAAGGRLGLVVWPETAVPAYVRHEHRYFEMILRIAEEVHVPILFGYPDAEYRPATGYSYFNAAALLDEEGNILGEYRKIHLVPFGERLPLHDRFDWVGRLNLGEADFTAGEEHTVFRSGKARFSATICFEAIFPSLCRTFVAGGARFLVNLTNDAWFGTTAAPYQHAAMVRLRSVESGIYVARSANTGISFISDPFGRVVSGLGLFRRGYVAGEITPSDGETFYVRHGDWLPRAELVAGALLLLAGCFRRLRPGRKKSAGGE